MKILLPVDGSELSLHGLGMAIELVRKGLQADFLLVNVQEPASVYELLTSPDPEVLDKVSQAAGASALQTAVQQLQEAGVPFETEVACGDPAHTLLELIESRGCELVVMATHGAGPLVAAWQGSVAQTLVHNSPVPVLLVKATDPVLDQPAPSGDT